MAHEKLTAYVATVGFITYLFFVGEVFGEEVMIKTPEPLLDYETRHLIHQRMEAGIVEKSILAEIAIAQREAAITGDLSKYKQLLEYAKTGYKT